MDWRVVPQVYQDERMCALMEAHLRFWHDLATDFEEAKINITRSEKNKVCGTGFISRMARRSYTICGLMDAPLPSVLQNKMQDFLSCLGR